MNGASLSPLTDKADVVRGVTFSKGDAIAEPREGYIPVLRAGNIQAHLILDSDLVYIPQQMVSEKQRLRRGDIVMCTSSGSAEIVGKTAFANEDWMGSFGAFCAVVRPKPSKCDPRYLFHYLQTPRFREWTRNSSGVGIKNIRKSELDSYEVPFPSLDEQRRIATILDKADAIHRKREQALALADNFLRSVFLEMFGDPAADGVNIQRRALSALAQIDTGKTPPTNNPENYGFDIPFVTPGDLGGNIDEARRTISRLGAKFTKIVQPGATLVCCIGATIGKMGFLTRPAAFNQQINAVTWGPLIDPIFGYIGLTFLAKKIADRGTSTTLPILNKSQFSQIMFPVPEMPKQRQFAVRVTKLWEAANRMQTQLHDANGLFQSLSQRVFAGDL